ncbi:MAG: hypothetical protein R3B09_18115 [Nannocystaceae bacterium]
MSTVHDQKDDDAEAAALLAAYRRSIEPPAGANEAIWAAIAARTGVDDDDDAPSRPRSSRSTLITIAIAAAVLLGIAAQLGVEIGRDRPATPQKAPYASDPATPRRALQGEGRGGAAEGQGPGDRPLDPAGVDPNEHGLEDRSLAPARDGADANEHDPEDRSTASTSAAAAEGRPAPRAPTGERGAAVSPVPEDRSTAPAPGSTPRASRAARAPSDEAPAPDLAAEMALIADAEAALRRGAAAEALRILDRHARNFPQGQLEPEREASRVSALCAQGRDDEARAAAGRFLARWPASHLARRVRESCGAP